MSNLADAIAYNNHDVDDGVRAGLINVDELREVRVFARLHSAVIGKVSRGTPRAGSSTRRSGEWSIILVSDLIVQSQRNISEARVDSIDAVRASLATVDIAQR